MSNGIRSIPRYQNGSATSPDPEEERIRRIWQLIAEQAAGVEPLRWERPDTLVDDERGEMMQLLHTLGADTAQVNQRGISDYFQSDELGRTLELASQLRGGPPPSMDTYSELDAVGGRYSPSTDEVSLNVLMSMIPQHVGNTDLPSWLASRRLPGMTQERWEQRPEDQLRSVVAHEIGHSIPGEFSTDKVFPQSLTRSEQSADNFAAVLAAINDASPDASERDILDSAQKIYWGEHGLKSQYGVEGAYSGSGGHEDPYIINPSYMESVSGEQRSSMRPYLERILAMNQYEDHPLNRGLLDILREGIGSLFGRKREP
jgi:hypothetical protein